MIPQCANPQAKDGQELLLAGGQSLVFQAPRALIGGPLRCGWSQREWAGATHTPAPALQVSSGLGVKAFQVINRNIQTVLPKVKNENSPLHLVLTATRSCFPCSSTFPTPLAYLLYRNGFPDQPEIWIPFVT